MQRRAIALFFVKVVVVYSLFLLPLHGAELYAKAFQRAGSVFFRNFAGGAARVYFGPMEPRKLPHDTTATITNLALRRTGHFDIDTRNMGYLATAFAFALIISSPVPWSRRVVAAILGVGIMSVFVWLQMYLRLVDAFEDSGMGAMFKLGPFWTKALRISIMILSRNPVTAYVFPVFVWAALTIRRRDLVRLGIMSAPAGQTPQPSSKSARRGRRTSELTHP